MKIIPNSPAAYRLLHDGALALSEVESQGMRIDVDYCLSMQRKLDKRIRRYERRIRKSDEYKKWKRYSTGKEFSVNSGDILADMLFRYGGHRASKRTASGKPSTDEETLSNLKIPVVKDILEVRRLLKARNTYLGNFIKESVDGVMRPMFNLHIAQTFRSSSEAPNFQNIPVRVPEIKRICRRAFIPDDGFMFTEIDYSGAEVKGAYCYHQDPNMFKYLTDPTKDMHRDTAMDCYILDLDQMTKTIRYCGKNKFVFPEFYGDYYKNCAENLWAAIDQLELETAQGVPLKRHLYNQNIRGYKSFEKHIQEVERIFWKERFRVYDKWKETQWKTYLKTGEIHMYSGFTCRGLMSRKEVTNYPVQGFAFHWLLWSFIQMHKYLKKHKLKTRLIGQIHDSLVMMIWPPELDRVIRAARRIMTHDVRVHWPVITIPLGIEVEVAPVNKSWYEKDEITSGPPCDCGNKWLYRKDDKISCPICGANFCID